MAVLVDNHETCQKKSLYLGGHSGQLMARHNGPLGGPGSHSHAPVTEVDIGVADPTVHWNTVTWVTWLKVSGTLGRGVVEHYGIWLMTWKLQRNWRMLVAFDCIPPALVDLFIHVLLSDFP